MLDSRPPMYMDTNNSTSGQQPSELAAGAAMIFQNVDSRYREQHKPRRVIFYCNGDRYYPGKRITLSPHRYKNFADLLSDLTNSMPGHIYLPNGVRQIFSPLHGNRITSLQDLVDGGEYVCAGNEAYKAIHYGRRGGPVIKERPFYPGGAGMAAYFPSGDQQPPGGGNPLTIGDPALQQQEMMRSRLAASQYLGYNAFHPRRYPPRGGGYLRWQPGLSRPTMMAPGAAEQSQLQSQAKLQTVQGTGPAAAAPSVDLGGPGALRMAYRGAPAAQRGAAGTGVRPGIVPATVTSTRPKVITVVRNGTSTKPRSVIKVLLNPASVQSFPQLVADISDAFGPSWKGRQQISSLYSVGGRPVRRTADLFLPEDDVFIALDTEEVRLPEVQEILEDLYPDHPLVPNLLKEWKKWQVRELRAKQTAPATTTSLQAPSGTTATSVADVDQEKRDSGFDEGKVSDDLLGTTNTMSTGSISGLPGGEDARMRDRAGEKKRRHKAQHLQTEQVGVAARLTQPGQVQQNQTSTDASKPPGSMAQFDYEEWQRARLRTQKRLMREKRGVSLEDNKRVPMGGAESRATAGSLSSLASSQSQQQPPAGQQPLLPPLPVLKQTHATSSNRANISQSQPQLPTLLEETPPTPITKAPQEGRRGGEAQSNDATASTAATVIPSVGTNTEDAAPAQATTLPDEATSTKSSRQQLAPTTAAKASATKEGKGLSTVHEEGSSSAPHHEPMVATPFADDLKMTASKAPQAPQPSAAGDAPPAIATVSTVRLPAVVAMKGGAEKPRDIIKYEEPPAPAPAPVVKRPVEKPPTKPPAAAAEQRPPPAPVKPKVAPTAEAASKRTEPAPGPPPPPPPAKPVDPKQLRQISGPHRVAERYELGRMLGDGNFAVVRYARHRGTNSEYAMKVIDKSKLRGKEAMIENEISIMKMCHHPNIVRLKEEFETKTEIYLVMELVKGGDLFDAITQSVKFQEPQASSMVKDMAEALFYLHSRNILHRDLKPENLMVVRHKDGSMNLKLADFGLAMEVKRLIFTVCGTPTYVAPEILEEKGYGLEVDMWALGVITYILLCGFPPFRSPDRKQTELFELIKAGEYEFLSPYWDNVSHSAKDLIEHLLVVDRKRRYSAIDVLCHPWVFTQGNSVKIVDVPIAEHRGQLRTQLETKAKAELAAFIKQKANIANGVHEGTSSSVPAESGSGTTGSQ